ncbi:DNA gyrase inhibitor YacG [Hypericibacter sp.]|uniref:DNA gyrase inhibitor YacG n=1 Tax=Hypericibacter sp. TaxID=2705401 RepID=UPI003D6D074B
MSAKIEDLAHRRAEREQRSQKEAPASRDAGTAATKGGRCPICGRPRDPAHRPFCSKRCAEIDLGRWLKESYRVQTEESPEDEVPRKDGDEE